MSGSSGESRQDAAGSERASAIFLAVLERPQSERRAYVHSQCEDDSGLESSVLSLLEAHEHTGPLDRMRQEFTGMVDSVLGAHDDQDGMTEELPPGALASIGKHLGRYEIRGLLGSGGMGEVYRAYDPKLERSVAIKVIGRRIEGGAEILERFEGEARAASALNHPNIITVHDLGEEEGHPFIVMELVEGESLRARLNEPMPADEMVRLTTQIVDGLAAAHEAGVVHRDLKPENILIDRRGTARILDFGIALFQSPEPEVQETISGDAYTPASGGVVGTVGYMSPEVLRSEDADHRSDQFALGTILYEMATGKPAFRRRTQADGLAATLREEPTPVSEVREDLPAALLQIMQRCLAKDRSERYTDTADLLGALQELRQAPSSTRRPRRGSLPTPTTPLHGRGAEMNQLQNLILEAHVRLVTLTGAGGSGKTRLALETARELEAEFPGGVVFVDLGGVQEVGLVGTAIAAAVGGIEAGGGEDLSGLMGRLTAEDGPILLLLDNFEQVIEAAPEVGALLEECPEVSVLVTSREVLHLRAEHEFPVVPLGLPPEGAERSPETLGEAPAVALFVSRAQAAQPDFRFSEENAAAVAELCRRLDGLPLALELAAARIRTFSPAAMLQRLRSHREFLTGGARDLPERQQTLRATLDWSHELLEEPEQAALRRHSVFAGGFSLEAAEAVVDPFGNLGRDVLELVESLRDQSLLVRLSESGSEPRFSMLGTVREYAAERLGESDEEENTRRAHAAYCVVLAEEAEAAMSQGQDPEWLGRFQREEANFRAALAWLIAGDRADWGLRIALGLFRFWDIGESLSEGRRRFQQLLELPSAQEDGALRAKGLFAAGVLAANQRDHAVGIALHQECLDLYQGLSDRFGQAVVLNAQGIQYTAERDYDKAQACYEESLALWEELGESDGAARSLSNFAFVLRQRGESERSRRLYRDAAAMFERLGDPVGAAWEVSHEADVSRDLGEAEAGELYRQALERFRELEEPWGIASTLVAMGTVGREEGEFEEAEAHFREALGIFWGVGHLRGVARALESLAILANEHDDDERILCLAGAADAVRERVGRGIADSERGQLLEESVTAARRNLGEESGEAAWRHGRDRPLAPLVEEICGS